MAARYARQLTSILTVSALMTIIAAVTPSASAAPMPAADAPGTATPRTACTIIGTPGNDRLVGTAGPDIICGKGGNDVLIGRGGDDVLIGGSGNDRLVGGPGDDHLRGGAGDDVLRAGSGRDFLDGGTGDDDVSGGPGSDYPRLGDDPWSMVSFNVRHISGRPDYTYTIAWAGGNDCTYIKSPLSGSVTIHPPSPDGSGSPANITFTTDEGTPLINHCGSSHASAHFTVDRSDGQHGDVWLIAQSIGSHDYQAACTLPHCLVNNMTYPGLPIISFDDLVA